MQPRRFKIKTICVIAPEQTETFKERRLEDVVIAPKPMETSKERHLEDGIDDIVSHAVGKNKDIEKVEESISNLNKVQSVLESNIDKVKKEKENLLLNLIKVSWNSAIMVRYCTKQMYSIIRKKNKSLGGSGAGGAIYGEMTIGTMQKIIDCMKTNLDFSKESKFLDIGSGLGKPSFHASQDPGVSLSMGIELQTERCFLSHHLLQCGLENKEDMNMHSNNLGKCWFIQGDVTEEDSLSPFTHIYSFDIGWKAEEYRKVAKLFNESPTCIYYVSYKNEKEMESFGFQVEKVCEMDGMSQHGSNSKAYPCFFYKKKVIKGNRKTKQKKKRKVEEISNEKKRKSRFEVEAEFVLSSSLETKLDRLDKLKKQAIEQMLSSRRIEEEKMCYKCFIYKNLCSC